MPSMPRADAPLIVITVGDPALSGNPQLAERKTELYVDAVRRHDGRPAVMSTATPPEDVGRLLSSMAGLVLTGGADIGPDLFGEASTGAMDVDSARDTLEQHAWHESQLRCVPVLGICRGLQAINVFSGGTLLQDVPSHAGTPYGSGAALTHNLEVDPDSRLARALAEGAPEGLAATDEDDDTVELTVNSFHHQAVNQARLAPTLRAVGWAPSEFGRLVEALEGRDEHWVMAVQCHPERTDSTPVEFEGVWEAFVRAAREEGATSLG
jgi:putative glutamine amidotransferase